jgi:hypothetical protein
LLCFLGSFVGGKSYLGKIAHHMGREKPEQRDMVTWSLAFCFFRNVPTLGTPFHPRGVFLMNESESEQRASRAEQSRAFSSEQSNNNYQQGRGEGIQRNIECLLACLLAFTFTIG